MVGRRGLGHVMVVVAMVVVALVVAVVHTYWDGE
jgi:hypothetical protein